MRRSDGSPDACDGVIDLPRSILSTGRPPKLTIVCSGAVHDGAAMQAAQQAVIDREDDADRMAKEQTAAYLMKELERRALDRGRDLALARALALLDHLQRSSIKAVEWSSGRWMAQMSALFQAIGKARPFASRSPFDQTIIEMWFEHDDHDRGERARLQAVLAENRV